jgi:hypothetical protein
MKCANVDMFKQLHGLGCLNTGSITDPVSTLGVLPIQPQHWEYYRSSLNTGSITDPASHWQYYRSRNSHLGAQTNL